MNPGGGQRRPGRPPLDESPPRDGSGPAGGGEEPDRRHGAEASSADWREYLHSLAVFGMRPGLDRVAALLERLGRPQCAFRAIHVVGTNGKSSTTRYAEAILSGSGLRGGAYLSPHITDFNERILVSGRPIAAAALGAAVERVRAESLVLPPDLGPVTQFEVLTVAAFAALAEAGVEAAAIEAGLGGRLDATNVLGAPVVVLTTIGLEHTEVLGDTRELIFAEKAAVIGRGAEVVFGPLDGLEAAAEEVCARAGARAHLLGRDVVVSGEPASFAVALGGERFAGFSVPSPARYQTVNAGLAVAACRLLLGGIDAAAARRALAATAVPGRLQIAGREPLLVADGAHNPDGVAALVSSLAGLERPAPRVGVFAIMADKAVDDMLARLALLVDVVVCTQASEARSLTAGELARHVNEVRGRPDGRRETGATMRGGARPGRAEPAGVAGAAGPVHEAAPPPAVYEEADPHAAVALARRLAGGGGSVLVAGSLYLLADLADLLEGGGAESGGVY